MTDIRQLSTYCGIAAPIMSVGAVTLATILAPPETFTWAERSLSSMGRYGAPTFPLFNGGLIASGLLGSPFVWRLWIASRNTVERVGIVLLAITVVGMIGVGVFFLDHNELYLDTSLHGLAALTVFGVAPFASWVYATGATLAKDALLAITSFWLGIVHLLGWLGWLVLPGGGFDTWLWFAVPEFVASVAFGGWVLILAVVTLRREEHGSSEPAAVDL
ncbi:DUF998 domain-containing protein [Natrinema halophilum]|uniref:DUF998 domain-containing protein n=1 Tax=Natrinema halophilum TaxID=1699371 RepID=A0A7D5H4G4_9EURY|nr:DUF998 domain-containing protein [Natrinema halophilum]QLG47375.1 DUF998 domain-containing protein [Natrinema halophilum]